MALPAGCLPACQFGGSWWRPQKLCLCEKPKKIFFSCAIWRHIYCASFNFFFLNFIIMFYAKKNDKVAFECGEKNRPALGFGFN